MPKTAEEKQGIVQSFNISPKGSYEGLLLKEGGQVIQINFPPEWSATVADLASPGSSIHVEIEPQEVHGHPAHPVFELLSLNKKRKESFSHRDLNNPGDGHFSGRVERLNYALHGEVNGAILNSGDFLHLKPHGAVAVGLTVGMNVEGTGPTKPMIGGHRVIEADKVNGIRLEGKPKPKKKTRSPLA